MLQNDLANRLKINLFIIINAFQTHLAFESLQTPLFSYTPHPGEFEAEIGDILSTLHKQHV